jgi:type I restriction enzyme, S subunit
MKKYEKYRTASVKWFGQIPAHWQEWKISRAFDLISSGTTPEAGTDKYYLNGSTNWVNTGDLNDSILNSCAKTVTDKALQDYSTLKVYPAGTILIAMYGATIGKTSLLNIEACTNQACCALSNSSVLENKFAFYWFLASKEHIVRMGYGGGQPNISQNTIRNLKIIVPPLDEQRAAVTYLDRKTAQLDTLLSQKQALLQNLHQQRQALINEAVTQGLNPAAPRKPSGVAWLGDVPAHWEIRKITRAFSKIGSGTTPEAGLDKYYQNGTINWVNTGDLNDGILESCQKKVTELALQDYSALKVYPAGTILVAMYGATIGKTSLMQFEACTNQACCALTTGPVLNEKFALYWFLANKPHIISLGYGGGQPNISQDTIRQLRIQTPPMEEQETIVAYLDSKTDQINEATATIYKQIQTLKAYRQSLISEVVTGKVDVRPAPAPEADLPLWMQ